MRIFLPLLSALLCSAVAPCQDLRRGLVDADAVLVGRQVRKTVHDEDVLLHTVQVVRGLRGTNANTAVTVIDWPNLSLHNRPTPRQSRLYCLQDAAAVAARLGLPKEQGPYFKMVGWAGSNPLIGADLDTDPVVGFANLLARSEAGANTTDTAAELCQLALRGDAAVRTEATRLLTERPDLCTHLQAVQWSELVAKASGEMDNIEYKIALAELCAEQRLDGLLESLMVSLGPVTDADYARTVGRIARTLHGEEATARLEGRLRLLREPKDRAVVLLAIGASNTESALNALLRMDSGPEKNPAVEAALREHRSPRAKEAVARRTK